LPDAYLSGVSFGLAQVADRHLGCPVIMAWSGSQCSCAHPLWEPMKVASGMAGAEGHRVRRTTRPRLLRVATRSMALVISPSGRSMYFRFSRPAASRSHSSVRRWVTRSGRVRPTRPMEKPMTDFSSPSRLRRRRYRRRRGRRPACRTGPERQRRAGQFASDAVEDQVDGVAPGRLRVGHHLVGSALAGEVCLVRRPGGGDHPGCSERLGQLHSQVTCTAGRRGDQY
jgi:hypothetical protein